MKISLPREIVIDIDNVPDNLEQMIQDSFKEYTEMTNPDYMYHDKLLYIDSCICLLHNEDAEDDVEEMILDQVKYELYEGQRMPRDEEVFGLDGLWQAYNLGVKNHELYSYMFTKDRHDCDKIMQILIRVITAVMTYGEDEESSKGE